ncbi:hypothetical protein [Mannheimia indoligenes]|uniref:DUF7210 family protein n=1 Tax=Mannheimia indoligenes TaxID=3103145 RepID=UPI002FE5C825
MSQKLLYVVIAATAILHNGKRYSLGDKIELTEMEAENLSLYVELDQSEVEKQAAERKAAEEQAEKERLAAEEAEKKRLAAEDAAKKAAERQAEKERLAAEEADKKAKKDAEKQVKDKAE